MELEWGLMFDKQTCRALYRSDVIVGWVVLLEGRWIARAADGCARAEFDTMEEAQQFLTLIANSGVSNE